MSGRGGAKSTDFELEVEDGEGHNTGWRQRRSRGAVAKVQERGVIVSEGPIARGQERKVVVSGEVRDCCEWRCESALLLSALGAAGSPGCNAHGAIT